jgi:hypothetical protein
MAKKKIKNKPLTTVNQLKKKHLNVFVKYGIIRNTNDSIIKFIKFTKAGSSVWETKDKVYEVWKREIVGTLTKTKKGFSK